MRHKIAATAVCLAVALTCAASQGAMRTRGRPALRSPACTNAIASERELDVRPHTVAVPGSAFGVVAVPDGQYAVASVDESSPGAGSGLAVLRLGRGAPRLVRTFRLPGRSASPAGLAISHDGSYLAVTTDVATDVLSLHGVLAGQRDALLGVLNDHGIGTIEATFSRDDRYLFVSDEYNPAISVFNVAKALRAGFSAPGVAVGKVRLGQAVVGSVLSPDGRLLYVTSEAAAGTISYGLLQVIDVAKAERRPASSLAARVKAGCQPVRVQLSAGGSLAWVTARGSDALLAFSTARLLTDPSRALVADVRVGPQPVGVLLTGNGSYALTANSARSTAPGQPETVSVVSTYAALHGGNALVGTIPAGAFPRQFGYVPATGQVLLTNYDSGTVEQFPAPERG